jgi:hypothetical protein
MLEHHVRSPPWPTWRYRFCSLMGQLSQLPLFGRPVIVPSALLLPMPASGSPRRELPRRCRHRLPRARATVIASSGLVAAVHREVGGEVPAGSSTFCHRALRLLLARRLRRVWNSPFRNSSIDAEYRYKKVHLSHPFEETTVRLCEESWTDSIIPMRCLVPKLRFGFISTIVLGVTTLAAGRVPECANNVMPFHGP